MRWFTVTAILLAMVVAMAGSGLAADEGLSASDVAREAPFGYEKDGRDIFTYREPTPMVKLPDPDEEVIVTPPGVAGSEKGCFPPRNVAKRSRPDYAVAEQLFAERRFDEALKACSIAAADAKRMKKTVLVEQIERLGRAAAMMERRRGAEGRLAGLELKIEGILIDGTSSVVVNGAAFREGDLIGKTGARLVKVERDGIVVLYEGFMVRSSLGRAKKEDAKVERR